MLLVKELLLLHGRLLVLVQLLQLLLCESVGPFRQSVAYQQLLARFL